MKVLVIGSGPIVIGQAAEFDYAGTQACKSLREEGHSVVLVNSNPATIMTDPGVSDALYIEPLNVDFLERIIARERPDALLPTLGGQTGLNLATQLADEGIIEKYGMRVLGTPLSAIRRAEDREQFRDLMREIKEPVPESWIIRTENELDSILDVAPYPCIIRPAYTLGGTGGGVASSREELWEIGRKGLKLSMRSMIMVERSLLGWKEVEYEVMRDRLGTCITVCNMENLDPMGVHTGDSIVIAPSQTLTDREHQQLRSAALRIIGALEIAGGCNVQFALAPDSHEYFVIEVNPRVSRSSALASKATGYPIARVAAKVALGRRLDEIPNAITGKTTAAFEPALDYCVVKFPRWPFDKFPDADRRLGTQMKSTGEVMAIERTFEAAFCKALRSLEQQHTDLELDDPVLLRVPNDRRFQALLRALELGDDPEVLSAASGVGPWFVERLQRIATLRRAVREAGRRFESQDHAKPGAGNGRLRAQPNLSRELLQSAKRAGMGDAELAQLSGASEREVAETRRAFGIVPSYKCVDTCAAEFEALTPYYYSCFEPETEVEPIGKDAVVVTGSGPIRIGQGIEFDYCSVQAARTLRDTGAKAVMVNSNPETVSTDFDCSNRLYFEPLDAESVGAVVET